MQAIITSCFNEEDLVYVSRNRKTTAALIVKVRFDYFSRIFEYLVMFNDETRAWYRESDIELVIK